METPPSLDAVDQFLTAAETHEPEHEFWRSKEATAIVVHHSHTEDTVQEDLLTGLGDIAQQVERVVVELSLQESDVVLVQGQNFRRRCAVPLKAESREREQEVGHVGNEAGADVVLASILEVPGGRSTEEDVGKRDEAAHRVHVVASVVGRAVYVVERGHESEGHSGHSGQTESHCPEEPLEPGGADLNSPCQAVQIGRSGKVKEVAAKKFCHFKFFVQQVYSEASSST
jgi:hypothetical protein